MEFDMGSAYCHLYRPMGHIKQSSRAMAVSNVMLRKVLIGLSAVANPSLIQFPGFASSSCAVEAHVKNTMK